MAAISVAVLLAGCQIMGNKRTLPEPGPVIGGGNSRAQLVLRCWPKGPLSSMASRYASNPSREDCALDYVSPTGRVVEVDDVKESIDKFLLSVADSHGWTAKMWFRSPYRLHLLSVDPVIVLMTPLPPRSGQHYSCESNQCLMTSLVSLGLNYRDPPKATEDALWFSPGQSKDVAPVVLDGGVYRFPVKGIDATLSRTETEWIFDRR